MSGCQNSRNHHSWPTKDLSGMEGKTNFSRRLYVLSGTGIVECLEIIDVGCNLKRFDVEADGNADENEIPFSAV